LGRINFIRRFIPNLAEIIKHITNMLRKGNAIRWTTEEKHSFEEEKEALTKDLVLVSPYFSRDFVIFSFDSEHTIAGVLMQKKQSEPRIVYCFFQ
jgi:hypothetical protein